MKKGQRYIVTIDEYSDYGIRDSFTALKNFSFDKTLREWLEAHGITKKFSNKLQFGYGKDDDEQAFLTYLRSQGFVADEPLNKVHLASYGTPEEKPANDEEDAE